MSEIAADIEAQTQMIRRLRQERQPSEVKLYRCPTWFVRLARQFLQARGYSTRWASADMLIWELERRLIPRLTAGVFNHWGSIGQPDGSVAFATEPYATRADLEPLVNELAHQLGCDVEVSENSWWFPGSTIRATFTERKESQS